MRGVVCVLPVQLAASLTEQEATRGGVSSFGYSGTIAHAVLACGSGGEDAESCSALPPLAYRRRAFLWREPPHPFAQRLLPTTAHDSAIFRSPTAGCLQVVVDHVVQGRVIFPGAGYMEMARAAAEAEATAMAADGLRLLNTGLLGVAPTLMELMLGYAASQQ